MEKNKLNILNKIFYRSTFRNCFDNGYDFKTTKRL